MNFDIDYERPDIENFYNLYLQIMNNVLESETGVRTINGFCFYVKFKYREYGLDYGRLDFEDSNIGIENLSREFSEFFELQYPLSLNQLMIICNNSDINVERHPRSLKARGHYFSYGNKIVISYRENDPPCSQIHTILHELYEIIIHRLYSSISDNRIERDAEQFSSYVHVPLKIAAEWINSNGLDVFGFRAYFNCSYTSALISLKEVLCRENKINQLPLLGILYERPYWENPSSGEVPRLQLSAYIKSKGFPFALRRDEIEEHLFFRCIIGVITIWKLINHFLEFCPYKNYLLHNVEMQIKNYVQTVDILFQKVEWKKYKQESKLLILIIPSEHNDLLNLVNRLGN